MPGLVAWLVAPDSPRLTPTLTITEGTNDGLTLGEGMTIVASTELAHGVSVERPGPAVDVALHKLGYRRIGPWESGVASRSQFARVVERDA